VKQRRRRRSNPRHKRLRAVHWLGWLLMIGGGGAILIGQLGRFDASADLANSVAPLAAAVTLIGTLLLFRNAPRFALTGIALAAFGVVDRIVPEFGRDVATAATSQRDVIIVTHNVWRDNPDPVRAIDVILAAKPDVVLLQEVSSAFGPALGRLRAQLPHTSRCPRDACPLMIFSRWPVGKGGWRFTDEGGRRVGPNLIHLRVEPPARPSFTVATLHLPRPVRDADGSEAIRASLAAVANQVGDPQLIVAGDFNLTPWAFAMNRLDDAMAPMARVATSQPTYPGHAWVPILPIDHVYAGPGWLKVSSARLPPSGSDHRGVVVRLQPLP
jgi:vancomycin resistance protein VanJ